MIYEHITTYGHACAIVTATVAPVMRSVSKILDSQHCDGMFKVGLNAIGSAVGAPATHFVNNGQMPTLFIEALKSPAVAHTRAQALALAAGIAYPFTLVQVTAALSGCSISDGTRTVVIDGVSTVVNEGPHEFIARLGLQMVRTPSI